MYITKTYPKRKSIVTLIYNNYAEKELKDKITTNLLLKDKTIPIR